MDTRKNAGFTIIETMLFLGVSGALTVGMLVGSGVAINQQRYKDSVSSLKSFIQQQYNEVSNVVNGREGSEACSAAVVIQPPETVVSPQARGTSECILLGRHVTIDATGKVITASNVVAYRTPLAPEAASDIAEITTNYTLGISPINQDTKDVAWGARVVKSGPAAGNAMPVTILILRSPLSGSIMTYSREGVLTDNLKSMVNLANSSTTRDLCVESAGGAIGAGRMSVQIAAYATNQGAIQVPSESTSVCG